MMYLLQGRTGFAMEIVKQIVESNKQWLVYDNMFTDTEFPYLGGWPACLIGKFRPSVAYDYCHESTEAYSGIAHYVRVTICEITTQLTQQEHFLTK